MIEFKHYTTMASNFSVLTRPLCLGLASLRSARPHTVGLSTQRSSQPLLCNVLIQSWKLSTAPSWLVIYHLNWGSDIDFDQGKFRTRSEIVNLQWPIIIPPRRDILFDHFPWITYKRSVTPGTKNFLCLWFTHLKVWFSAQKLIHCIGSWKC